MMNYKAIDILKTLSAKEIRDCMLFMDSQFLNKSKKVAKLYSLLVEYHPDYSSTDLTEERLSRKISPHLDFNKSSMKNLFADLAESLENYFVVVNFLKRDLEKSDVLREEYFKRRLWKHFLKNVENTENLLNRADMLGTDHFLEKYKLYSDKFNYLSMNRPKNGAEYAYAFGEILNKRAMNITGFFTKELVRQYENMLAMNRTFNIGGAGGFMSDLFDVIDFEVLTSFMLKRSDGDSFSKLFQIYNAMFKCFRDLGNGENYYKYKRLILKNSGALCDDELRFHLIRLVRYCLTRRDEIKAGKEFEVELFNVYKFILEKNYYKTRIIDYMPVEFYRTIVLQSLKLKDYDYAEFIINNYRRELHPDRRENMNLYSRAMLNFHKKYYEEALENCQKVKLDHFVLKFELKDLLLMISYETGHDANVRSMIDSYRHLLKNDNLLSKKEKMKYKNFLNAVAKLFVIRNSKNLSDGYEVEKLIQSEMTNKDWIREKLSELQSLSGNKKNLKRK
jgi:hypothetical protein